MVSQVRGACVCARAVLGCCACASQVQCSCGRVLLCAPGQVVFPDSSISDEEFSFLASLNLGRAKELNKTILQKCSGAAEKHKTNIQGSAWLELWNPQCASRAFSPPARSCKLLPIS